MMDQKRVDYLVKKWSATELLDGKTADSSSCILLVSQEKQIIDVSDFYCECQDVTDEVLRDIPNVTRTLTPNARIDWDTMVVSYGSEDSGGVPFATKSIKRSIYEIRRIVQINAHQIVVYWVAYVTFPDKKKNPEAFRPGYMLRFAIRPHATLITPDN